MFPYAFIRGKQWQGSVTAKKGVERASIGSAPLLRILLTVMYCPRSVKNRDGLSTFTLTSLALFSVRIAHCTAYPHVPRA